MLIKRAQVSGIDTGQVRISNHTFRATFGTNYLRACADINQAWQMMGHKSADTTAMYDHRDMMELARDVADKLS